MFLFSCNWSVKSAPCGAWRETSTHCCCLKLLWTALSLCPPPRPLPSFPQLLLVWRDSANYLFGVLLTGVCRGLVQHSRPQWQSKQQRPSCGIDCNIHPFLYSRSFSWQHPLLHPVRATSAAPLMRARPHPPLPPIFAGALTRHGIVNLRVPQPPDPATCAKASSQRYKRARCSTHAWCSSSSSPFARSPTFLGSRTSCVGPCLCMWAARCASPLRAVC